MFLNNIKQNLKKTLLISGSSAVALSGVLPGAILSAEAAPPEIDAEASITVDYETGQILQGVNIDTPLGIASMTKMIVEYIVFEEVTAGNLSWDTEITVSQYAYEISQNYSLSNVALRNGEAYSLEELYEAMAIYSANGATIAIAEHISGTEPAFVDRMKETVESFGITDAILYNATGLNNSDLKGRIYPGSSESDENSMSARSAAIIANKIVADYPEILETASIPKKTFRPDTVDAVDMTNWNWMVEGLLFERENVDGLKTGTTDFAGSTFTGTAEEEGRRLITVVLNSGDDNTTRFVETDKLMDYGFDNFKLQNVTDQWTEVYEYEPLTVINGREQLVNYEISDSLEMLMALEHSAAEDVSYTIEWNPEIVTEEGIEAPFEAGLEIGRLVVDYAGNENGYLEEAGENSVPVVTSAAVDKANLFIRFWNWVRVQWDSVSNRF